MFKVRLSGEYLFLKIHHNFNLHQLQLFMVYIHTSVNQYIIFVTSQHIFKVLKKCKGVQQKEGHQFPAHVYAAMKSPYLPTGRSAQIVSAVLLGSLKLAPLPARTQGCKRVKKTMTTCGNTPPLPKPEDICHYLKQLVIGCSDRVHQSRGAVCEPHRDVTSQ